ncbi:gfo/Idh/MocA family oxidoreductase [Pseudarcicella sp. GAP-15]|nr:gfo/Idh/MocA family oxidoreductase [Pseudarcicella sp. GAP-15]
MNILLIGLGSIAKKHILALRTLKLDFKIYALRSIKNAETEEGIENIFDLDEANVLFDFAIISNPTHLHFNYIEKLANKGIDLFIEKPAIHSLENSDKLVKLIREKKIKTYVACNMRFHPCITFLKNKLDNETIRINEVNVYCGSYLPDWRPTKNFRTIYSANASMGGGVHLDLFHEIDYTTWLFGLPNESKSILKSNSSLNIDSIDYANFNLGYDVFSVNIILNYYRRKPKREIEIVLENEIWKVDLIKNEIKNDMNELLFQNSTFNIIDSYINQLEYYITCLKNKITPMNSLPESIEILKICLKND